MHVSSKGQKSMPFEIRYVIHPSVIGMLSIRFANPLLGDVHGWTMDDQFLSFFF